MLPHSSTSPKTGLDYDHQNYSIYLNIHNYTNKRLFIADFFVFESCPQGLFLVQKVLGQPKIVFDLQKNGPKINKVNILSNPEILSYVKKDCISSIRKEQYKYDIVI